MNKKHILYAVLLILLFGCVGSKPQLGIKGKALLHTTCDHPVEIRYDAFLGKCKEDQCTVCIDTTKVLHQLLK